MKKALLLAAALVLLGASIASAAVPGMNLGWNDCALTLASQNFNFACDDNTLTRDLVLSFRLGAPVPDYVGAENTVEFALGDAGTPPWFQFGPNECREGVIGPVAIGAITGCVNPYSGAFQAGGWLIEILGPNRYRLRIDWARDVPGPLLANTLYSVAVLRMDTSRSWDEGAGGVCEGCAVPACFVFKRCGVWGAGTSGNSYLAATLLSADVRNWATYQGGAFGAGCPGETPSKTSTWGAVKALYR